MGEAVLLTPPSDILMARARENVVMVVRSQDVDGMLDVLRCEIGRWFLGKLEDLGEVDAPKRAELHEVTWSKLENSRIGTRFIQNRKYIKNGREKDYPKRL